MEISRSELLAQLKGWFENDLETENFFGYHGPCDVDGAAADLANRIEAVAEQS